MQPPPPLPTPPSKPIHPFTISILLFSSLLSLLILSLSLSLSTPPHTHPNPHPPPFPNSFPSSPSLPSPPSFSYLLTGSSADSHRLFRLLLSLYHPRNTYLLHLDLIADQQEREGLARMVQGVPLFRSVGNVHVLGKADFAYQGGSSALSSILHGAAVLLRVGKDWDWFVNVHVNEYPLVTQDALPFTHVKERLDFVDNEKLEAKSGVVEGGNIGTKLESVSSHFKFESSGNGGTIVKVEGTYKILAGVTETDEVAKVKEGITDTIKAAEAYLVANPNYA